MNASRLAAGLLLVSSSTGCFGPPFHEKQVRERHHVEPTEEAQKQLLVENEECEIAFLRKYASSDLVAARVLVAGNAGADDELRRVLSRSAFASNPKLPDEIRERILRSDNRNAKGWLEITDERKRHAGRL
jgi:hypothetical protein